MANDNGKQTKVQVISQDPITPQTKGLAWLTGANESLPANLSLGWRTDAAATLSVGLSTDAAADATRVIEAPLCEACKQEGATNCSHSPARVEEIEVEEVA